MGECTVDLALREIHAPDARRARRVTPKAIAVLLALAAQPGKVIGRDALLAQVWPDTLPTDDVLTQAVTQLRKAFGEQRGGDGPRYIETIAKTGYRLLAPVEPLPAQPPASGDQASDTRVPDDRTSQDRSEASTTRTATDAAAASAQPAATADPAPNIRFLRPPLVVVAIALLLAVTALWAFYDRGSAPASPATRLPRSERPYRLITSLPGFEQAPTLSPDASMVAYAARPEGSTQTVVMVQTTDQSHARALSQPPSGYDDSAPAWSPDGREIAFLRKRSGIDCRIMVMPAGGGSERTVAACDPDSPPSFDWKPDGSALLFGADAAAPGEVGLRELDLASGDWRSLLYTYRRDDVDASPRYSPDGRWIVFVRNSPLGDFWRIPADGGDAERLTDLRADIRGWDWGPDGESLLFGSMVAGDTRLFQLELGAAQPRDLGIADGFAPATVPGSRALAFVQRKPWFGLMRIEGDELAADTPSDATRLFASSGRDVTPAIAPDGRQLAFISDRSGPNGLWWADLERAGSLRHLAGVRPDARHGPEWSPDSRRLLISGSDGSARGSAIFELAPASGQVTRLPIPVADPLQAAYLADPDRLLVVAGASAGRPRLTLFDRSDATWRALASLGDVSRVQVDLAGQRVLFTRHSGSGLWEAGLDLDPASVRQVATRPSTANYRMWEVDDHGRIYAIEQRDDCATWLQPLGAAARVEGAGRCLYRPARSARVGFSLGPRNRPVFISPAVYDDADIGFMTLPVNRGPFVPGWAN